MSTLHVAVRIARNAKTEQKLHSTTQCDAMLHVYNSVGIFINRFSSFPVIHSPEHQKPTCTRCFKVK